MLAAWLVSACGGTAHSPSKSITVHLDGHVVGDYVRETSATGTSFLVPTGVLTAQRARDFDIATPPPANPNTTNPNTIEQGPKLTVTSSPQAQHAAKKWFIGPSIAGTTPQRARAELLVTGDPGRRIHLSFEESCGFFHVVLNVHGRRLRVGGPKAVSARKGASGQRVLRTPAVMIIPSISTKPENSCYVSGVVVTRGRNDLHVSLIDY